MRFRHLALGVDSDTVASCTFGGFLFLRLVNAITARSPERRERHRRRDPDTRPHPRVLPISETNHQLGDARFCFRGFAARPGGTQASVGRKSGAAVGLGAGEQLFDREPHGFGRNLTRLPEWRPGGVLLLLETFLREGLQVLGEGFGGALSDQAFLGRYLCEHGLRFLAHRSGACILGASGWKPLAKLDHVHVGFPKGVGARERQVPSLEPKLGRSERALGPPRVH